MKMIFSVFVFVSVAYYQSCTAIGQPIRQREQGQANQQATVSLTPTPSVQPTVEERKPQPARDQTDRSQGITIVDERSPWPAWIANGISAFVLLFLAFQTIVNRGMLNSMKKTEGFLESQCTALAKQTDILEQSYRVNSRAYVFIENAKLKTAISSGDYPHPTVEIKNFGKTPAYSYRIRFHQGFLTEEEHKKALRGIMPPMTPLGEQGHALGPGADATIHGNRPAWKHSEEREAAIRGLIFYHIWGLICYVDVFGDEHAYKFSLYARNQTVTHLSWGRSGNDMEEKTCKAAQASN